MPAVTQMNGKHVTPRIWAQEARSDVTCDPVEEARRTLRGADGAARCGAGTEVAGRGGRCRGWACSGPVVGMQLWLLSSSSSYTRNPGSFAACEFCLAKADWHKWDLPKELRARWGEKAYVLCPFSAFPGCGQ